MLPDHLVYRVALEISGGPSFPYAREISCMGRAAAMLMVRDSILADERSSGAEDGLLRKTQTEKKKVISGAFLQAGGIWSRGLRRASR